MPLKDGTGPKGKGSRTGRGMGNCTSTNADVRQPANNGVNQQNNRGGRFWDRLFGRRRPNRKNNRQ